ncbi:hypothetical protein OB08_12865 [Microbacterium sp. HJ5]
MSPVAATKVTASALAEIDRILAGRRIAPDNPGRIEAAQIFMAIGAADSPMTPVGLAWIGAYAEAALEVAKVDVDNIDLRPDRESKAEMVVAGTVLGDRLFGAFRRAAGERVSRGRYGATHRATRRAGHGGPTE